MHPISSPEKKHFLLSRCHSQAKPLDKQALRPRDNTSSFSLLLSRRCHAYNRYYFNTLIIKCDNVTTWQHKKQHPGKRKMSSICDCVSYRCNYNKGLGWRNKNVSWQAYCIRKHNKDIYDSLHHLITPPLRKIWKKRNRESPYWESRRGDYATQFQL